MGRGRHGRQRNYVLLLFSCAAVDWCYNQNMTRKSDQPKKPPLTDAERHKRFVDMAQEVGASEKPEAFDKAFKKVTAPPKG